MLNPAGCFPNYSQLVVNHLDNAGLTPLIARETASSTSIEDVAEANGDDGHRWYQLYWPPNANNDITISILNRAKKAGFKALFVTLDTYVLGWRPSDMDNVQFFYVYL